LRKILVLALAGADGLPLDHELPVASRWISHIHAPDQFFAVDPLPKIRHPRIVGWDAQ
jgi:hypothetical protein